MWLKIRLKIIIFKRAIIFFDSNFLLPSSKIFCLPQLYTVYKSFLYPKSAILKHKMCDIQTLIMSKRLVLIQNHTKAKHLKIEGHVFAFLFQILILLNKFISKYIPFLAGEPPTILLWGTFENPHPSSGVSKRPLMGNKVGVAADFGSPPEQNIGRQ